MTARAMWKGVVSFGDERTPVKVYAAAQDRRVHFQLLHASDGVRIKQRMVRPDNGEAVPADEIRRGVAVAPDTFVVLDEEELEDLEPVASRTIEVLRFVARQAIDHPWYDRPYWLGPDGDDPAYHALAAALAEEDREGVARWVMRKKRYVGVLRAVDGALGLVTLRRPNEVVDPADLERPLLPSASKGELDMARQLVSMLAGDFDAAAYHDEHRERVRALVEAKAAGKELPMPETPAKKKAAPSLREALQRSLDEAGRRQRA